MTVDTSKQLKDRRSLDNRRLKARLIDAFVLIVPTIILVALLRPVLGDSAYLIAAALQISYFYVCEATWGATIGKHRMGLRVINADGGSPGANSVAARNVLRVVEEPFLALIVMVLSGGRRKRIGDFIGSTAVGSTVYSVPPPKRRWTPVYPLLWVGSRRRRGPSGSALGSLSRAGESDLRRARVRGDGGRRRSAGAGGECQR